MPRVPRPRQPGPPEARAKLEEFTRDYERRQREHGKAAERLRAERDEAIRQAHKEGMPLRDIAAVVRLSHQHVSRIARGP